MGTLNFLTDPTNLISVGISLVIIGFVAWSINRTIKKEGITLTDYFNDKVIGQHMGFVLLLLFSTSLAESIIASTIPHPHEFMNPVGRFIGHLSMNIIGVIMLISLPSVIVETITSIEKILKNPSPIEFLILVLRVTKAGLMGYAAFKIPYWNFEVIAQGLKNLRVATFAFNELTGRNMKPIYEALGLGRGYSPFEHMSNQLYASLLFLMSHYILALVDGFHATIKMLEGERKPVVISKGIKRTIPVRGKQDKNPIRHKEERETEIAKKTMRNELERGTLETTIETFLYDLVNYVNPNLDGDSVNTMIDEIISSLLTGGKENDIITVSATLKRLHDLYLTRDTLTYNEDQSLKSRIMKFFRKPITRGGLGRAIPRVPQ